MLALRVVAVVAGVLVVAAVGLSAVKTVVLPRGATSVITRALFLTVRRLFDVVAGRRDFRRRDAVLAYYAPVALLALAGSWVALALVGFALVFWGLTSVPFSQAWVESGSSLLTLGFERPPDALGIALAFVEAAIGLGLVALLIAYLPTMYGAFNRRETLVGLLEGRAGVPPSPGTMLTRYHRIGMLPEMDVELFPRWEEWFADVEESHTSLPALVFFRSPQPGRSWITAAGCVLDTAALLLAAVEGPRPVRAPLCLRTGFFALRRVADYFGIAYDPDPTPDAPISITREEFDDLLDDLTATGVPVVADRDRAWRDYAGWRVNYDTVLLALAALVAAPPAAWSSDRAPLRRPRPRLLGQPAR